MFDKLSTEKMLLCINHNIVKHKKGQREIDKLIYYSCNN